MSGIDQFTQKVKKHGLPTVVAFGGDERALIDDALLFLRREAMSDESFDLNHHKFIAGENGLEQLTMTLSTMPFLARVRMVEIHQAEKLTTSEMAMLAEYVKNPSPSTLLVLLFNKADKRNKLVDLLNSSGALISFDVSESDAIAILLNDAKNLSLKIDNKVAHFLASAFDHDLLAIKSALQKLALVFSGQELSIDDIEKNLVANKEQDVFLLARYISEGRIAEALTTLGLLKQSQEHALKFLGVLAWQMRTLVHLRHCLDQGMLDADIRKTVGVFSDRYAWMSQLARKKPMDFHVARLARLLECDAALKSVNISEPFNLIEKVVYQCAAGL